MTYLEQELHSNTIISRIKEVKPYVFDGQWIWNLNEPDDSFITPSFYKDLGFNSHEIAERDKEFWKRIFNGNDLEQLLYSLTNRDEQSFYETLIQLKGKNGDVFWAKCTGIVFYNGQAPERFIAFIEKRSKVQELENYFNLQRKANKIARIGTWEVNMLTQNVYWSKVTKEIYAVDYSYQPVFDQVKEFYNLPYYKQILEANSERLYRGEEFDVKLRMQPAVGKRKWVRMIGIPVMENGICVRAYGLLQDVDAETTNMLDLQEKEALFRNMFEFAAAAIIQVSLDDYLIRANYCFYDLVGYTYEEMMGRPMINFTHPDDVGYTLKIIESLIKGEYYHKTFEKRYIHKNGSVVWALVSISIVIDKNSNPLYILSQIVDITEKKKSDAQISLLMNVSKD